MRDASLTLMQTFYFVAKEGSYSAAARRLNLSYQSAANHIRRLEQNLGYKLVHSEQGMKTNVLTARGKKLFQLLMPELDTMLARLGAVIGEEAPLVRIGMPQAIFYYLFQDIIRRFGEKYAESEIICFERDLGIFDLAMSGQLDVFITERTLSGKDVRQYLIGSYGLVLIYPASWPAPPANGLARWANKRPFITYEPGHLIRNMALRYMSEGDRKPRLHVSTSGASSVKRCVTSGAGFAVIPRWAVGDLPKGTAAFTLDEWPKVPVYFGEATYLEHNPYVRTLRELCLGSMAAALE